MKPYYGWTIVAISVAALALTIGASIQAYGLFVLPVSQEFGLTRADVNTGAILFNIGMAVWGALLGRLLDRHSARLIMAASAVLFTLGLVGLGLSHSVILSALLIACPLAAAAAGCGTVTSPTLVARWFTVHRGRAMAIAMLGVSVGPVVVVPLISLLMEAVGWRQTLMIVGVAIGAILLGLVLLVRERPSSSDIEVRHSPDSLNALDQDAGEALPLLSAGTLLRLPQFWTISFSIALAFGIMQVVVISLVPFGQAQALSLTQAAGLLSMYGGSAMVGSLLFAWLGDRVDRLRLMIVFLVLFTILGTSFLLATNFAMILAVTGLFGFIGGMITPAYLALLADRFGAASFGTAAGTASLVSTIVGAASLRAGGEMFDRTGNYQLTFVAIAVVGTIAVAILAATNPLSRTPKPG